MRPDISNSMVKELRAKAVGERLGMAHVSTATPISLKRQFLPGYQFSADLKTTDAIAFRNLAKMAPDIVKNTLSGRCLHVVDMDAIHDECGCMGLRSIRAPVLVDTPVPILRAVIDEPSSKGTQAAPIANNSKIKATSFKCLEESSTSGVISDEVYWLFGSVAKGFKMTNGTHTYNSMDAKETWNLGQRGMLLGHGLPAHAVPEEDVGCRNVGRTRRGRPSDVLEGWTIAFGGATAILVAGRHGMGGSGRSARWRWREFCIELMADNHIADHSWSFNKASINEVLDKHGGSYETCAGIPATVTPGYNCGLESLRVV